MIKLFHIIVSLYFDAYRYSAPRSYCKYCSEGEHEYEMGW